MVGGFDVVFWGGEIEGKGRCTRVAIIDCGGFLRAGIGMRR
jgi:hypothetical protein